MSAIHLAKEERFHHLFYGNPSKAEVSKFNAWLKANPETTVRLYHGSAAINPILTEGIKKTTARRRNSLQSSSGYVCLSVYPGSASDFANFAALNRGPDADGFSCALFAVDLRVAELLPDKDQLFNQRLWAERHSLGNSIGESLVFGRGARFKGDIDARRIQLVARFNLNERPDFSTLSV